ncbi:MAG TPA: hypothetical protein VIO38_06445 [Rariglobus sp.]
MVDEVFRVFSRWFIGRLIADNLPTADRRDREVGLCAVIMKAVVDYDWAHRMPRNFTNKEVFGALIMTNRSDSLSKFAPTKKDPRCPVVTRGLSWRQLSLMIGLCALSSSGAYWAGWSSGHQTTRASDARHSSPVVVNRQAATDSQADKSSEGTSPVANPGTPRLTAKEIVAFFANPNWQKRIDGTFKAVLWLAQASEDELAEVLSSAKSGEEDGLLLIITFARWTEIDGLAAFEAFSSLAPERRTSGVTENLFNGWMLNGDPEEALDYALAYRKVTEDAPRSLVADMLEALFEKDRDKAEQITLGLCTSPDPATRAYLLRTMRHMVEALRRDSGLEAGLALISKCPIEDWREDLRQDLALELLRSNSPVEQRQGYDVLAKLPDPYANMAVVEAVANRKLADDALSAKAWALTLPIGEGRKAAITEIVQTMVNSNQSQEALDWISTQVNHVDFDEARETLATAVMEKNADAGTAFRLAAQISDEARSNKIKISLSAKWLEADFNAAAPVIGPALVDCVARGVEPNKQ